MPAYLLRSAQRLKQWTVDKTLPIWAERAQLPDGSWVEHLDLSGQADMQAERRWRIMARQSYVYAQATQSGWFDGKKIAETTHRRMMELGYVHRVGIDGDINNPMQDLYDHAFYLLSHASLYKLTKDTQYLDQSETLLTWLDRHMSERHGGWKENSDSAHLRYADHVFDLFKQHFFNQETHTIREFFKGDWTPQAAPRGTTVEMGHSAEWVWLLMQYETATHSDTSDYAAALYDSLHRNAQYFLNDEAGENGEVRRESKRLWVQTELIKAHLAQAERGISGSSDMAAALIDGLFETYLTPEGFWNDQLNACGVNMATTIPVSTFYHILCMAVEAERVAALQPHKS